MTAFNNSEFWDEVQPQGLCPWNQCAEAKGSHAKGAPRAETGMYALLHEDFERHVTQQFAQKMDYL